jgi:hypothetical protein
LRLPELHPGATLPVIGSSNSPEELEARNRQKT